MTRRSILLALGLAGLSTLSSGCLCNRPLLPRFGFGPCLAPAAPVGFPVNAAPAPVGMPLAPGYGAGMPVAGHEPIGATGPGCATCAASPGGVPFGPEPHAVGQPAAMPPAPYPGPAYPAPNYPGALSAPPAYNGPPIFTGPPAPLAGAPGASTPLPYPKVSGDAR